MKNIEIINWIESFAPKSLACEWDNVGLMVGNPEDETRGIVFALDLTSSVLDSVINSGSNLVITHHPLYLDPLILEKEGDYVTKLYKKAEIHHITVYSAHTNLDFANGGINDTLIKKIGIKNVQHDITGIHPYGDLPDSVPVDAYYNRVVDALDTYNDAIVVPENKLLKDGVKRIGVSCGAFDDDYNWLVENDIEVLVTGEMKLHQAIRLREMGIIVFTVGHYESEFPGLHSLAAHVNQAMKAELEDTGIKIRLAKNTNPYYPIFNLEDDE